MDLFNYVNIKQGTKSSRRFSNGNTMPLVQLPFGFASFSPQTDSNRGSWFYHPDDRSFEGIRLTHQPSPWIRDRGAIVILPQSETPELLPDRRWSGFSEEVLTPYYLKYSLTRAKATIELTPTLYGGCVRMEFESEEGGFCSVLPVGGNCSYRFDAESNRLYCSTDYHEYGEYGSGCFCAYTVFEFEDDAVLAEKCLVQKGAEQHTGVAVSGENTAIHLWLNKKSVTFRLAQSFIGFEQAILNLESSQEFDSFKEKNKKIWFDFLSRLEIDGDETIKKTAYSCLYRVFLFPRRAYEINARGKAVHYSPFDDQVKEGVRYTDNGFWDTYRTVYPLFSLIAPEEYSEMLEGFLADYKDGGWLPCWTAIDPKKCMPGTLIDAVFADAAVKGILKGDSLRVAFEGMEKHANSMSKNPAYGRAGIDSYLSLGYVPCDEEKESVNLTLDGAYCDWCLSVVADCLGETEKAEYYRKRANNYKNLFDFKRKYMIGKNGDGVFEQEFNPFSWGGNYTEASGWQTTFSVPHDPEGLAELYGGKEAFLAELDRFFATPPKVFTGGYGHEIHEMTEFMAGNFGQCAICNQPSFHIPFFYAYFGEKGKTEYWVHRICKEAFSWENDGFPGDEDNGTMAAWYLFALMGQYPLCPGRKEPVFFQGFAKKVVIKARNEN